MRLARVLALCSLCIGAGSATWAQDSNPFELFAAPTQAPPEPDVQSDPEPVFDVRVEADMEERVVRPFYTRRSTADGAYSRTQVLWPLWLYERADERLRVQLLPFYYYYRDVHRYGDTVDTESDWSLFPVLWGGDSTRDGGYLALFPLGGRVKGLLAKDEIRFAAFPLWLQWRDKGHVSNSWLWPIFTRGTGGGKETLRVWPLYGRTTKEGWYDRRFYAWPFVLREEFDLDSDMPGRRGMTWPFWTYEYSAHRTYRAVAWPFFSREENVRRKYTEVAAPWPFFVRRTGDSDKLQLWPLFTGFTEGGRETHHVAGPLVRYSRDENGDGVVRSQTSVALVIREERIEWPDSGEQYLYSRVWPFFDYETWPSGASRTNVLSPLWFRDPDGFGYQYAPVYTLYHHERRPDGSRLSWALWNLYRHERTTNQNTWRLGPLVRFHADHAADEEEFTVLGGMIGIESDPDRAALRLLWGLRLPLPTRGPEPEVRTARQAPGLPAQIGT